MARLVWATDNGSLFETQAEAVAHERGQAYKLATDRAEKAIEAVAQEFVDKLGMRALTPNALVCMLWTCANRLSMLNAIGQLDASLENWRRESPSSMPEYFD